MNKTHSRRIMTSVAISAAIFAQGAPAFAFRGGDAVNFSTVRHESSTTRIKLVHISGALSCDRGDQNTGESCALKLQEAGTGKTYNLTESRSAMQLFTDGTKNVVIEGRLADSETIEVKGAKAAL